MKYKQMSHEERYRLAAMKQAGMSVAEIAEVLGRAKSTIYRELKRNRTPYDGGYRPSQAVEKTNGRRSRSRRNKRYGKQDFGPVERELRNNHSPEQIVGRARALGKKIMSHETIYCHIWADKAKGGELWRHLRGARKLKRKRYRGKDSRGRLAGKKAISERPAIVETRKRFGDWEIDTVHGSDRACILTLVERKSRFVQIAKLTGATADEALRATLLLLKPYRHSLKSITSDNGTEFHCYKRIEEALGVQVYFATPHHAWERGTNENTNGLIRQYLPKRTSLHRLTQKDCDSIASMLNSRPRKVLNYYTPMEVLHNLPPFALQT